MGQFQAGGFLVSSNGHTVAEETELSENVYSMNDYADTASLLEQVSSDFSTLPLNSFLFRHLSDGFIYYRLFIMQDIRAGPSNQSGLRFISGIICKSKVLRFERMLFRATRGNMLFNQAPADEEIMDPVTAEMV